ncbi:MAG: N-acetyltransferase family protein [Nocardioides sp.]
MTTSLVRTRYGTLGDVAAVTELHDRCSPESLYRRFHAPMSVLAPRLAHQLIAPVGGWSLLAEQGAGVVGMACAGPLSSFDLEVGLFVEDASQGLGVGARLLREVAADASGRGYRAVHCLTQPDNDAVLATIRKAGLPAEPTRAGGLLRVVMPLAVDTSLPRPA